MFTQSQKNFLFNRRVSGLMTLMGEYTFLHVVDGKVEDSFHQRITSDNPKFFDVSEESSNSTDDIVFGHLVSSDGKVKKVPVSMYRDDLKVRPMLMVLLLGAVLVVPFALVNLFRKVTRRQIDAA